MTENEKLFTCSTRQLIELYPCSRSTRSCVNHASTEYKTKEKFLTLCTLFRVKNILFRHYCFSCFPTPVHMRVFFLYYYCFVPILTFGLIRTNPHHFHWFFFKRAMSIQNFPTKFAKKL